MNEVEVHIDLDGATHRVGTMRLYVRGGRNSVTFEYHKSWLDFAGKFSLEPTLMVGEGIFTPDREREMFACIGDSAPDTWGRRLMQRMERRTAKKERRAVRTLTEIDYLLGVADIARMGALRFKRAESLDFQTPLRNGGVPLFIDLPRLLAITERLLRDEDTDEDLLMLFAPGSSLGGARPKASVRDHDGHLLIAKFPKEDDDYCIGGWEDLALSLAENAGINTSRHRTEIVAGKTILLSRRFDRNLNGDRVPFLSAMSMLDLNDGVRSSYPELVDVMRINGLATKADTIELYRRMIFNILISNVDDHLRNHGFLWTGDQGWKLSPAYDLNPVPADVKAHILSTNISLDEGTCSIELARQSAGYFNLTLKEADEIIRPVADAVACWRQLAKHKHLRATEIERMESAFDHDELKLALTMTEPKLAFKQPTCDCRQKFRQSQQCR